jgi:undecaprenyl-diphosphatase
MTGFDEAVLLFLNRFAQRSWSFDLLMDFASRSNLLKGGVMAAGLWGLWFWGDEHGETRRHVIATVVASIAAIAVARTLALRLPFRLRPIHNDELGFVLPYGTPEWRLDSWSAFPSDHAVLFFALATGIWCISRTAGILAMTWVTLAIAFPRLYLGLHYPTDILVGAAVGVAIAAVANLPAPRRLLGDPALRWLRASPTTFYACFFLLSFQIAVLFNDGREFASLMYGLIAPLF